jgi:GT2 family glycosyltransferase
VSLIDVPSPDVSSTDVPSVDVIVPVHGAGPVFRRCAASLIAHADVFGGDSSRLVIVLDGPPDAESVRAVEELRAAAQREEGGFELSVLTHEKPLGFVLSVNRALRESTRDAVLLNSDTQVTAGWLGRLREAAYSDPKVATVTPFSNNATICSLPRFLDENAIPAGHTIDSFGALVTRVTRREYPRLPTGVGFCLYVKRTVLDEVGAFDEAFGLGYGEEVDLCLRAASRGYVHVLDDATFVFHEGSRSFGRNREHRMRLGERIVLARYPDYLEGVAEFIKRDPIAPARARVLDELRRTDATNGGQLPAAAATVITVGGVEKAGWPRRVLHLVPGWPPWTNEEAAMSVRGLVRAQSARREVFAYARMADPDRADGSAVEYVDGGVRVRLIVASGAERTLLSRAGLSSDPVGEDFARFLADVRPQVVHVHDLAGQSLDLLGAARARAIRAALKSVDAFVMGSQSVADRYASARLLPRSAHVAVSPFPLNGDQEAHEEIERVYAELMNARAPR